MFTGLRVSAANIKARFTSTWSTLKRQVNKSGFGRGVMKQLPLWGLYTEASIPVPGLYQVLAALEETNKRHFLFSFLKSSNLQTHFSLTSTYSPWDKGGEYLSWHWAWSFPTQIRERKREVALQAISLLPAPPHTLNVEPVANPRRALSALPFILAWSGSPWQRGLIHPLPGLSVAEWLRCATSLFAASFPA